MGNNSIYYARIIKNVMASALVAGAIICINACGPSKGEILKMCYEGYHTNLQWQKYREASLLVAVENQEAFWAQYGIEHRDEYRAFQFEIESVIWLSEESNQAKVIIRRSYFKTPSVTVKKEMITQTWEYNEDTESWFLVEGF